MYYKALFKLLCQMLTYDSGLGSYSIKFTAKDGNDGPIDLNVKDGKHCGSAGICNPEITFHREGAPIVLQTWNSAGLCKGGVLDQLHKGGNVMGFT